MNLVNECKFLRGGTAEETDEARLMRELFSAEILNYSHDQYILYPSAVKYGWAQFARTRLEHSVQDPEYLFFYTDNPFYALSARISRWDEEHFGFRMAFISLILTRESDLDAVGKLLDACLKELHREGVKFVSARISGDDLDSIHAFERRGFAYYETIIWPVLHLDGKEIKSAPQIRLMTEDDLPSVLEIAGKHQFKRSHYHSDNGFDPNRVDEMHAKWAMTSWKNGEPSAIIEHDGKVAGYFAFRIDGNLSAALGYRYARMRSLTLDSQFRGKGLGKTLFAGTLSLMAGMGADIVDSGYSSKNHRSARLHVQYGFEPVFEEVTLHKWL